MFNQRGTPPRPIRGYSESAEAYLDRLGPWLDQVAGGAGGGAAGVPDVYDTSGRVIFSGRGLYAYAADGSLPVAPNVVQIDTQHIVDAAIETAKLGDGAVTGAKILDATIGTAKIADAAIVTAKIGDAAIVTAKIGDLAVNRAKIANAAVGSAQIEDLAVTNAKIASLAADKITAGTLNAGLITVINLSADSITTGTLVADRIAAGSITTGKVASNAVTQNTQSYIDSGLSPDAFVYNEVNNVTLSTTGGPVLVCFNFVSALRATSSHGNAHLIHLERTGSSTASLIGPGAVPFSVAQQSVAQNGCVSMTYIDTPPAGTHTYRIHVRTQTPYADVSTVYHRYISAVELKR